MIYAPSHKDIKTSIVTSQNFRYNTKFLVIATGTTPKDNNTKNNSNIFIGSGSKITETDFSNQSVAILGGGDNAAENYLFIKNKKVKYMQEILEQERTFYHM